MLINEIPFTLKDGRSAVLRSPKPEDIPGMLEYLRLSAGETEFILRYPEECGKYTPEKEQAFFDSVNASPRDAMLVCAVDGKVAGNCQISFLSSMKTRHRGSVAIALLKEFWGQGIGTRMFAEMIHIGERDPYALQLELEFIEGNDRARALYEKMGFRITGMRPNGIRLKNGAFLNEYAMTRILEK